MSYPAPTYRKQLRALLEDLNNLMKGWSPDHGFVKARVIAEATLPLIAGVIERLHNAQTKLYISDAMALSTQLEELLTLMEEKDKSKFAEYIAMLDSLINEGVS